MLDRVPTKPSRYAVYDDNHNFLRHEYHERADEPTEVGTPLNKATFLKDTTAALYGEGVETPDGAFVAISSLLGEKAGIELLGERDITHLFTAGMGSAQNGDKLTGGTITGIVPMDNYYLIFEEIEFDTNTHKMFVGKRGIKKWPKRFLNHKIEIVISVHGKRQVIE